MVETLDLNDEVGSLGATNINIPRIPSEYSPEIPEVKPKNTSEKNIITDNNNKVKMDSTPINELMMEQPAAEFQQPQMAMPQTAQAMAPQQPQQPQFATDTQALRSKNPFNMTDEQMDAVVAAVSALIAFSAPAQERLGSAVPNFFGEDGSRSITGMLVTGTLVALFYFIARKYIVKP